MIRHARIQRQRKNPCNPRNPLAPLNSRSDSDSVFNRGAKKNSKASVYERTQMTFQKDILCIGAGDVGDPTMAMIACKCPQYKLTMVDINPERMAQWEI
jgi:hypothetical protein